MTYYDLLEVSVDATPQDIKAAYYRLSKDLHPDKLPPDTPARARQLIEEQYKQINEAYSVLSDAAERRRYDQQVHPGRTPVHPPRPSTSQSNWFDPQELESAAVALQQRQEQLRSQVQQNYQSHIIQLRHTLEQRLQTLGYNGNIDVLSQSNAPLERNLKLGGGLLLGGFGLILLARLSIWLAPIFGLGLLLLGALTMILALQTRVERSPTAFKARQMWKQFQQQCRVAKQQRELQLKTIESRLQERMAYFQGLPTEIFSQAFVSSLSPEDKLLLLTVLKRRGII